MKTEKVIFAGGCFWGVEYYMKKLPGVLSVTSGYTGGHTQNPTFESIHYEDTGHIEAVQIEYDPEKTDFETLTKYFFEIHDPTQVNRQGPDIGEQYQSAIFYSNDGEQKIAEKLISTLKEKGFDVVTKVLPASKFWPAETYHQDYYAKTGRTPYCHSYTKRF